LDQLFGGDNCVKELMLELIDLKTGQIGLLEVVLLVLFRRNKN